MQQAGDSQVCLSVLLSYEYLNRSTMASTRLCDSTLFNPAPGTRNAHEAAPLCDATIERIAAIASL